jgi:hypothetical protein
LELLEAASLSINSIYVNSILNSIVGDCRTLEMSDYFSSNLYLKEYDANLIYI